MLVLTRKVDERIQIGDDVVVTVVRIAEGVVRLGIEAPRDMVIVRREICVGDSTKPAKRTITARR